MSIAAVIGALRVKIIGLVAAVDFTVKQINCSWNINMIIVLTFLTKMSYGNSADPKWVVWKKYEFNCSKF